LFVLLLLLLLLFCKSRDLFYSFAGFMLNLVAVHRKGRRRRTRPWRYPASQCRESLWSGR
jgi:hypothetical protein